MKIIIGGDLVVNMQNISLFEKKGDVLSGKLKNIWEKADFRIFNLESPITDNTQGILKSGPLLKIEPKCYTGIKSLKPNLLALANNHIMDYGEKGLSDTLKLLKKDKIDYVGVGSDIQHLKKYIFLEYGQEKIAIYNCAETEFTIASDTQAGANPYHDYFTNKDISELKKQCQKLIVIYHGGKECYRYPSPKLQERCRIMAENGADYVFCQHSHCIGCEEKYKKSVIVYGQGNFFFQPKNKAAEEMFSTSLLIAIDTLSKTKALTYIPIKQNLLLRGGVELCEKVEAENILKQFQERSEQIKSDKEVKELYRQEVCKTTGFYLDMFPKTDWLGILNNLQNEVHREAVICAIQNTDIYQKYTNVFLKQPSVLEKIFSIKNDSHKKHKVIRILGLSFKIKRRQK